ncbi:MAG: hypothetical protein PF495_19495 [Spirochaetales bacterium]|jgi:hypothetical protein|nr:hypothetical protein [Spirochaetales bacterium]
MSVSEVQICNMALLKFGDITIDSIVVPTNREGRSCKVLYPILRDLLLYHHPWNFAMTRADISAVLADDPPFEFKYAYTIPVGCLRVVELYGSTADWVIESGQLLTNQESDIYIKYVRQVKPTGNFNPAFVNCLATRLGAELAAKI